MRYFSENLLLFYASMPGHDDYIINRTDEIVREGVDWQYMQSTAEALGVTGGLLERFSQAKIPPNDFITRMNDIIEKEIQRTASMLSLYKEISSLLEKNGFRHIPLKGCDKRITDGPRNFFNVMEDIDVLVRISDVEDIGRVLEENGYYYQGSFSGSHMNFFTDEKTPRFIEIHWDLINRENTISGRLFQPSIDAIWERSITVDGESLLFLEDLLSYLTAHGVKEYFHKPKWLTDIAWIIENCSNMMEPVTSKKIIREWGTSRALGIISYALKHMLCDSSFDVVWTLGARKPGLTGRYLARRLVCYDKLRSLRPLLFIASAESLQRSFTVTAGMVERYIRNFGVNDG